MSFFSRLRRVLILVLLVVFAGGLRAQSTVPALITQVPAQSVPLGGGNATIDLRTYLALPGVTGQVVQFDTVLGKYNVELFANDAPQSVANFLTYVDGVNYGGTIFHRALGLSSPTSNRIVQGGGYDITGTPIVRRAPINLEYKLPNARGTVAMARSNELNSATSEWYFNVDDNTDVLGASNGGGYAVFGRVLGTGLSVVEAIAALPTFNAGGALNTIPLRDMPPNPTEIKVANLIIVNSVSRVATYASGQGVLSAVTYSIVGNSNPNAVNATLSGTNLVLAPTALGSTSIVIRATDVNGNTADATIGITVPPRFTTQPASQARNIGESVTLTATAANATSYQWQRNGVDLSGATNASLTLGNLQPADAGVYTILATGGGVTGTSQAAVVGVSSTVKVVGDGEEVGTNIQHPLGNIYDQVLLKGPAATITADPGQVTRISYIDLTDDIVQVEFSGPGTLTLVLDNASGPATPVKYNQPTVSYMKGHASIVISGAGENTHAAVFSVGRANAINQALFKDVTYDGFADISSIAIASADGKFGSLRTANASYLNTKGMTGVYAADVAFQSSVFVNDINVSDSASPMLILGSGSDVRITGGDLEQANGRPVQVNGITQLKFAPGASSHGTIFAAQNNKGKLVQNGADVTAQIVVNP